MANVTHCGSHDFYTKVKVIHFGIRHGLVSAQRSAAITLFHGQERDLATEPSLYGTVYQQQFVKLRACIRLGASSKHICLLYVLITD